MKKLEKYHCIMDMQSIGLLTNKQYPSYNEFKTALKENRISGDYTKKVVIVSNDLYENYTFKVRNEL